MARPGRGVFAGVGVALAAVLVAVAVLSGAAGAAGRAFLYGTGLWVDGGSATVPAELFSTTPTPTPTPTPVEASPVLPPYSPGKQIDPDRLAERIAAVSRTDVGTLGALVLDGESGKVLYRKGQNRAMTPASTMKLLTSAAVLDALGPGHRFVTAVQSPKPGTIVLVGGGDPYLRDVADEDHPERASLADLAEQTAATLKEQGVTKVRLRHDARLFAGTGWNPTWPDRYGDEVAATSALWVNGARTNNVNPGPRDADPAQAAARKFAAALEKEGIEVAGEIQAGTAGKDSEPIAEVESEPLDVIVESVLRHSDNDAAEVLFRHVGAVDGSGSIKASAAAVKQRLSDLDVWVDGTSVVDGSGMSRDNAVPARLIAKVVALGLSEDHPDLRSLLTGLPVAASTGSLQGRFFAPGTELGRGAVRAKTGTLTKVHALGGYTRTESGRVVVFAFLVNGGEDYPARVYLDRVASAVTACGC